MKIKDLILIALLILSWLMTACEEDDGWLDNGTDNETEIILDSPLGNSLDSPKVKIKDLVPGKFDFNRYITITFRWHIKNPDSEATYYFTLLFYGGKYFDAERYDVVGRLVGDTTEYTMVLSRSWRWNGLIKWAVKAEGSNGQVYESALREVYVLPKSNVKVILDYPPDDTVLLQDSITFRWHLENAEENMIYNYALLFDKGVNPFDGFIEKAVNVGESNEYTLFMSASWWASGFQWGVAVESSDGAISRSKVRTVENIVEE